MPIRSQLKKNTDFTALAMPCLLRKIFLFFLVFFFLGTSIYAQELNSNNKPTNVAKAQATARSQFNQFPIFQKEVTSNYILKEVPSPNYDLKEVTSNYLLKEVPSPNYALKNEAANLDIKSGILNKDKDREFLKKISFFNAEIEMDGFFELRFSSKYYTTTDNEQMLLSIQNDPAYKELPKAAKYGPFNLDPLYNFNINAKFSERLSTKWNVEQEPDFPSKYQIGVTYDNTEVGYGNFNTNYNNGNFVKINKSLQGFKVSTFGDNWNFLIAKGQERSDPQIYQTQINDTKLTLPNQTIMQGTVKVYINDALIQEIKDYTVDYENGIIYFKVPQTKANIIKVIYEYTSPVADFIPILSNKNFLGVQAAWSATPYSQEIIATDSAFELIPVTPELLNSTAREIRLEHFPLIFGSEKVSYKGQLLKEGDDYLIKADKGSLILLNSVTANESIEVRYEYYRSKYGSETIQGNNTNGPYLLAKRNIVKSTVECKINEQAVKQGVDYQINEIEGKVYFTLPQDKANLINITYAYLESKRIIGDATKSPLSVGISYFEESSAANQGQLTEAIANEKPFLASPTELFLSNNPIVPSSSINVIVNGQEISSANYTIDNYFGKITLNQSIDPSSDIKVNYLYQKSSLMETSFRGKTGYQSDNDPYTDGRDFFLPKRPVKFQGVYQLTLYSSKYPDGFNLREGYEYLVNYDGNKGQGIEIYFIKRKPSNPASLLIDYPDDKTAIKIKYLYTPNLIAAQGTAVQNMLAVSGQGRPNKDWQVKADVALTNNNFSRPRKKGFFAAKGTGVDNYNYNLGNTNIVENSESVFINDLKQQKDTVYYINYEQGTVNFRNFTPSPADNIRVEYQFYDTQSQIGEIKQAVSTLVQSDYKINDVTIYGDFKSVPKEFLPIGYTADDKGYFYGGGVNWQLNNKDNVKLDVHQKNYYLNTDSSISDSFLKTTKILTEANVKIFGIENHHELTYTKSDQDPSLVATTNSGIYSSTATAYQGNLAFGPDDFRTTIPLKLARTDSLSIIPTQNQIVDFNYLAGIKTTYTPKIQFIEKFVIAPYVFYTRDESVSQNIFSKKNDIYNYGLKTNIFPIKELEGVFEYDEKRTDSALANEQVIPIRNQAFGVYYKPIFWVDLGINFNHTEKESPAIEQFGRLEDSQTYNINKFIARDFLKSFNSDFLTSIAQYTASIFSARWNTTKRNDQNFKYQYNSNNYSYNLRDFEPIEGIKFTRLSYDRLNSNSNNNVETSTTSSNSNLVQNSKKEGELIIKPKIPILNYFTYSLYMKDYRDYQFADTLSKGSLFSELRELPEFNRKQKLSFNLDFTKSTELYFLNPKNNLFLSFEESYVNATDQTTDYIDKRNVSYIFKNSDLLANIFQGNFVSTDLFSLDNQFLDKKDYYNRNDTETTKGSLYKFTNELNDGLTYKISPSFTGKGRYKNNAITQWFSLTPNISKTDLPSKAENILQIFNTDNSADLIYTPIEFLSLKGGANYKTINQFETISTQTQNSIINQLNSIAGLIIRPITYLELTFDYVAKNSFSYGQGNALKGGVYYKTKIEKNFYADIELTGEYTTGYDLNTITQENNLLSNAKMQKWQVINRKDLQISGVLSLNIEIPIPEFKYIEKFIISGSGRIKIIQDYLYSNNSYNISGIVLSGKILF